MFAKWLWASTVIVTFALLNPKLAVAAEDQTVDATGKVTLNGKPIPMGRIILFPVGADQFVGAKIKDGAYKLTRVPVGTHIVTVEAKDVDTRFASEETSGLRVEVRPGRNEFDFDLKSR